MPNWKARRTTEFTPVERQRRLVTRVQRQEGRSITSSTSVGHRPRQWFGADNGVAADGTTDNAAAVAAVLEQMLPGDELVLESGAVRVNSTVVIAQPMVLRGGATLVTGNQTVPQIHVQGASNVTIADLTIAGVDPTTWISNSYGIRVDGGGVDARAENITIRGVTLVDQAGHAIWMDFARHAVVEDCRIERFARGAVIFRSPLDAWVQRCYIDTATMPRSPTNRAYGILFTRDTTQPLAVTPHAINCHAYDNEVRNIPAWEAVDTHGGQYCWFERNKIFNCFQPILAGGCPDEFGVDRYGPKWITIAGNVMESGVDDGTYRPGIIVEGVGATGATLDAATGCKIAGNTVVGHGDVGNSNSAGIQAYHTDQLAITGNFVDRCGNAGIILINDNKTFQIVDNRARDFWSSNDVRRPPAVGITFTNNNSGFIAGTSTSRGSKVATRVNERGIYVAAGNVVDLGKNPLRDVVTRTVGITE